jgi:excisionase family DNA binding protein
MDVTASDAFSQIIQQAVVAGMRTALNISEATNRRLLSVEETALYLSLSEREIYNMGATRELLAVKHGRRTMFDLRDLDRWIELNKAA